MVLTDIEQARFVVDIARTIHHWLFWMLHLICIHNFGQLWLEVLDSNNHLSWHDAFWQLLHNPPPRLM